MNRTFLFGAALLSLALVWGSLSSTPAVAQCSGGMMGICQGGESCHDSTQQCTPGNCPGGMMGSCMDSTQCNNGMMGNCHEGSGGGSPCPMEECPMENCPMPEMCEMMGMMGGCGEMMGSCCDQSNPGTRRTRVHLHSSPNPFNPVTTLNFSLTEAANLDLRVYDLAGREVAQLASGVFPAGNHSVAFNGTHWSTGIYLARLQTPGSVAVEKLVLLK